jgi:hypothetical protein
MTKSNVIPITVAKQREDKRLAIRQARAEKVRRKLLPLVVIVCETFSVAADDLIDPGNRHPVVVMARDIVRWVGYHKLHVGITDLNQALGQSGTVNSRDIIPRITKKLEKSAAFARQVACVEALLK